ncbi:hypothetical protein [Streptomyces sp. MMG1121]|uniref:hypothetical protein n=1 Tax=Streptomyces sp. MMG1121 TaxID=1415544 RepID=UPI0006AE7E5C|nr:hypothetical protein [Streptomyces sp. MMG1121]KOV61262.1 hypothetical protein ADK64_28420 [Streptomyces sp. MMG1121]
MKLIEALPDSGTVCFEVVASRSARTAASVRFGSLEAEATSVRTVWTIGPKSPMFTAALSHLSLTTEPRVGRDAEASSREGGLP